MSETLRITNLSTTYVEKLRPNNIFYNSNFLLCGIFYINLYSYDSYKTLINFTLPEIDINDIDKISLFLFIDNVRLSNNMPFSLSISSSVTPFNIFITNWNNQPAINSSNIIITNINSQSLGRYVEIDITNIIKNAYTNFQGIILQSTASKNNSILRFTNINSSTPPYVQVVYSNKTIESASITTINQSDVTNNTEQSLPTSTNINTSDNAADIIKLNSAISNLEEKYNALQTLINSRSKNSNLDNVSSELTNLTNQRITALEEKIDNFSNLIDTLNLNYDLIRNNLTETDTTISTLVNHLAEIEVKLSSFSSGTDFSPMIDSLNSSFNNLQLSLNAAIDNHTAELAAINAKIASLNNSNFSDDLKSMTSDISGAINTIKPLEEKITLLSNELTELKVQYDTLKQQINSISITPIKLL